MSSEVINETLTILDMYTENGIKEKCGVLIDDNESDRKEIRKKLKDITLLFEKTFKPDEDTRDDEYNRFKNYILNSIYHINCTLKLLYTFFKNPNVTSDIPLNNRKFQNFYKVLSIIEINWFNSLVCTNYKTLEQKFDNNNYHLIFSNIVSEIIYNELTSCIIKMKIYNLKNNLTSDCGESSQIDSTNKRIKKILTNCFIETRCKKLIDYKSTNLYDGLLEYFGYDGTKNFSKEFHEMFSPDLPVLYNNLDYISYKYKINEDEENEKSITSSDLDKLVILAINSEYDGVNAMQRDELSGGDSGDYNYEGGAIREKLGMSLTKKNREQARATHSPFDGAAAERGILRGILQQATKDQTPKARDEINKLVDTIRNESGETDTLANTRLQDRLARVMADAEDAIKKDENKIEQLMKELTKKKSMSEDKQRRKDDELNRFVARIALNKLKIKYAKEHAELMEIEPDDLKVEYQEARPSLASVPEEKDDGATAPAGTDEEDEDPFAAAVHQQRVERENSRVATKIAQRQTWLENLLAKMDEEVKLLENQVKTNKILLENVNEIFELKSDYDSNTDLRKSLNILVDSFNSLINDMKKNKKTLEDAFKEGESLDRINSLKTTFYNKVRESIYIHNNTIKTFTPNIRALLLFITDQKAKIKFNNGEPLGIMFEDDDNGDSIIAAITDGGQAYNKELAQGTILIGIDNKKVTTTDDIKPLKDANNEQHITLHFLPPKIPETDTSQKVVLASGMATLSTRVRPLAEEIKAQDDMRKAVKERDEKQRKYEEKDGSKLAPGERDELKKELMDAQSAVDNLKNSKPQTVNLSDVTPDDKNIVEDLFTQDIDEVALKPEKVMLTPENIYDDDGDMNAIKEVILEKKGLDNKIIFDEKVSSSENLLLVVRITDDIASRGVTTSFTTKINGKTERLLSFLIRLDEKQVTNKKEFLKIYNELPDDMETVKAEFAYLTEYEAHAVNALVNEGKSVKEAVKMKKKKKSMVDSMRDSMREYFNPTSVKYERLSYEKGEKKCTYYFVDTISETKPDNQKIDNIFKNTEDNVNKFIYVHNKVIFQEGNKNTNKSSFINYDILIGMFITYELPIQEEKDTVIHHKFLPFCELEIQEENNTKIFPTTSRTYKSNYDTISNMTDEEWNKIISIKYIILRRFFWKLDNTVAKSLQDIRYYKSFYLNNNNAVSNPDDEIYDISDNFYKIKSLSYDTINKYKDFININDFYNENTNEVLRISKHNTPIKTDYAPKIFNTLTQLIENNDRTLEYRDNKEVYKETGEPVDDQEKNNDRLQLYIDNDKNNSKYKYPTNDEMQYNIYNFYNYFNEIKLAKYNNNKKINDIKNKYASILSTNGINKYKEDHKGDDDEDDKDKVEGVLLSNLLTKKDPDQSNKFNNLMELLNYYNKYRKNSKSYSRSKDIGIMDMMSGGNIKTVASKSVVNKTAKNISNTNLNKSVKYIRKNKGKKNKINYDKFKINITIKK